MSGIFYSIKIILNLKKIIFNIKFPFFYSSDVKFFLKEDYNFGNSSN